MSYIKDGPDIIELTDKIIEQFEIYKPLEPVLAYRGISFWIRRRATFY